MITGAAQMDGGILVVSAADGPYATNSRAHPFGSSGWCSCSCCFLNKCDQVDDEELLELVELEIRELLSKYEFPGDDIPIVKGSALKALEGDKGPLGEEAIMKLWKLLIPLFLSLSVQLIRLS